MATGMMIGAGIGALSAKLQGGNMLQGALMGGAMGGIGGAMGAGASGLTSATTATNSLGGGASLLGGGGSAIGSGIGSGTTSLLGSATGNMIPAYDMGMNGVTANLGGFTAIPEASQVVSNSYVPFANDYGTTMDGMKGIGPDFSSQQTFLDTSPTPSQANFGTPQPVDYANEMGAERIQSYGASDGVYNKTNDSIGPNFNTSQITKSTPDELGAAQGGYKKPLYERAFESVMDYASKNPIQVASLGLTAFGDNSEEKAPPPPSGGPVLRQQFNPRKQPILNVRRA